MQGSKIPQLQVSRVARLQISRARVLDYQGSGVPSFQCSRFQASRFQTRKGLGLIHQQRNDQRNAKQTQNTIELLQFFKEHNMNSMIHSKTSTLQLHKVKGSKFFHRVLGFQAGYSSKTLRLIKFGVPRFHDSRASYFQHSKFPGSKIPWTKGSIP